MMLAFLETTSRQSHFWGESTLAFLGATAKLCVPFLFALLLIWAREYIVSKRERKLKQDALWIMLIDSDESALAMVLEGSQEMAQTYERGEISTRMFLTSETIVPYTRRLIELDPKHAHIYSAFELEVEGSRKRDEILDKLREQFYKEPDEERRNVIVRAISAETRKSIEQIFSLLEQQINVLRTLQVARKKDKRQLEQFENLVETTKQKASSYFSDPAPHEQGFSS